MSRTYIQVHALPLNNHDAHSVILTIYGPRGGVKACEELATGEVVALYRQLTEHLTFLAQCQVCEGVHHVDDLHPMEIVSLNNQPAGECPDCGGPSYPLS